MTPSSTDEAATPTPSSQPAPPALGPEAIIAILGATLQLLLRSQVGTRKDDLAWQMNALARSLRGAELELSQHQQPTLAGYAGASAGQIEAASRYLHDHDFNAILRDIDHLAHERPAVVMGAMLGMGVLIGRFIKHSALPPAQTTTPTPSQA